MKILHEHGFPVPRPIDQARHCILMEFIDAYPLRQVSEVENPGKLYSNLMDVIVRFAQAGLIHGDYNEFNILIKRETGEPVVIDFPQMVSTSHENAEWYFNRDVECIRTFFKRRFRYESSLYPRFRKVVEESGQDGFRLDVMVEASGFGRKEMKVLEEYMESVREEEQESAGSGDPDDEVVEEEDEEQTDYEADEQDVNPEQADQNVDVTCDPTDVEKGITSHSVHQASSDPTTPQFHGDPDSLKLEDLAISDLSDDRLSRSPPQSRREAPVEEQDEDEEPSAQKSDIKSKVASDISKKRSQQQRKYHSKRSTRSAGRAHGSKAKQDTRVKSSDHGGVWG